MIHPRAAIGSSPPPSSLVCSSSPSTEVPSTFFIYTAAFLPFTISSTRRVLLLFLAEAALIAVEGLFFRQHLSFVGAGVHIGWPNVFIAVFLLLVIGGANIFFAEQKRYTVAQLRSARELRDAQDQNLALAAVAERERIARDLHDVLGHTLSVITLKAELAGRLLNSETARDLPRAAAEIADVERLARTSLSEVREAITGYRSRGLSAEIEAARRTLDAAGVTLHLADSSSETSRSIPSLTPDEETILSLALREAVTNIVRHARATHCALRFTTDSGTRHLIIEDNGQSPAPPREGNGLRGMRARIESIGGKTSPRKRPRHPPPHHLALFLTLATNRHSERRTQPAVEESRLSLLNPTARTFLQQTSKGHGLAMPSASIIEKGLQPLRSA